MRILSLKLEHFRNYEDGEFLFGPGSNLLYGENAQGKTNILEAVYLCTCARSHRTGKDTELIQKGHDRYQVALRFADERGSEEELIINYRDAKPEKQQTAGRDIFYQGIKLDKVSEMFGLFHAVIFAPEDLSLVKDGPTVRRRFLDLLISQLSPSYFRDLQQYQGILLQKNSLLKHLRQKRFEAGHSLKEDDYFHLSIWNQQMADVAARIISTRALYIKRLEQAAARSMALISASKEELSLHYRTVSGIDLKPLYEGNKGTTVLFDELLSRMEKQNEDEIKRGSCSYGPHRDDLEMSLNQILIRSFASQGQQRSVVLSMKMAELDLIREETGEKPVLLLDDVMSELDPRRRERLLQVIEGHQVLITATDVPETFENGHLNERTIFRVESGKAALQ